MNPLQQWRKKEPRHPLRSPLLPPQEKPEAPAAEATLPEASVVEGEYSAEVEVPSRVVVVAC
jgi:hypothetical protein